MTNRKPDKRPSCLLDSFVTLGVLAALAIHFTLTAIYLAPLNPIGVRLAPSVNAYIRPLFEQDWKLFAPNPMADTKFILVSCRVFGQKGELVEKSWSNMSMSFLEIRNKYRVSPADRLARAQQSSLVLIYGQQEDPLIMKLMEWSKNGSGRDEIFTQKLTAYSSTKQKLGVRLLRRTASAECDRLYGQGNTLEVKVRIIRIESPPFSKRTQPLESGPATQVEYSWEPYEAVAPMSEFKELGVN